jgi:hypothetical protein
VGSARCLRFTSRSGIVCATGDPGEPPSFLGVGGQARAGGGRPSPGSGGPAGDFFIAMRRIPPERVDHTLLRRRFRRHTAGTNAAHVIARRRLVTPASPVPAIPATPDARVHATDQQPRLHAFMTRDGHWRAEAVVEGEMFMRQCADWNHVEHFRDWLQGRTLDRVDIATHVATGERQ